MKALMTIRSSSAVYLGHQDVFGAVGNVFVDSSVAIVIHLVGQKEDLYQKNILLHII